METPGQGLRLRLRAPLRYRGKLRTVQVGGKGWDGFSPHEETVDFTHAQLREAAGQHLRVVAHFQT
jgi:hypothetical protein